MGFKFSAVATTDKFSKENIDSFSVRFFCNKLIFEKEVILEESMNLNYQHEYLDILFLKTGTFIFGSNPSVLDKLNTKRNSFQNSVGIFSIEETSMVYMVDYYENTKQLISFVEHNGEKISENIENITIEYSDGFDLTVKLIKKILDKDFYELEPDLKLYRYKFSNNLPILKNEDEIWVASYSSATELKNEKDYEFTNIRKFKNGVSIAELNGKFGLINEERNKVSKFIYDRIESFENEDTNTKVQISNKWGSIDIQGNEIVSVIYDEIKSFSEGLACVKKDNKYGFVNLQNTLVIPFNYNDDGRFSHGLAAIKKNGKYGFIDKEGKEITQFIYDDTWTFNGKFAFVYIDKVWSAVDINGKTLKTFDYDSIFSMGIKEGQLHNVQQNGKWGCIDDEFNLIIECIYNNWIIFSEGFAEVRRYLIKKEDLNKPFEKISYVDLKGIEICPYKCDEGRAFKGGFAAVRINDKWGFINTKGDVVVPIENDLVEDFNNGILRVVKNGQVTQIRTTH